MAITALATFSSEPSGEPDEQPPATASVDTPITNAIDKERSMRSSEG
jgi:hypothetical protein